MRLALAAAALLACTSARAENLEPLQHQLTLDIPVTAAGGAAWLGSELFFKAQFAPKYCRWCEPNGFDTGVRNDLKWSNTYTADLVSNLGAFGLAPGIALIGTAFAGYHDDARAGTIGVDVLVILEAAVIAQDVNQATKFIAGRERPFVHALPEDQKPLTKGPTDNNLSFFSGHATWVFSLATAAGTVSSMHGYRLAPAIWTAGLSVATVTSVLRIGADKHYATDVLTGAVVGSLFGVGIPLLLHHTQPPATAPQQLGFALEPTRGGMTMGLSAHF